MKIFQLGRHKIYPEPIFNSLILEDESSNQFSWKRIEKFIWNVKSSVIFFSSLNQDKKFELWYKYIAHAINVPLSENMSSTNKVVFQKKQGTWRKSIYWYYTA